MKRYVLTGTPGAGKTSILRALEAQGYGVVEEAATDIIAWNQAQGIAEPWKDAGFVDSIVELQKQRQTEALPGPIQFHDRSAICCYALSKYLGYNPSALLLEEINRLQREEVFERDVFFIENLGFCEPSAARRISFEDSLLFEELHCEAYRAFGYQLITIAKNPVVRRVNEIVRFVEKRTS